MSLFEFVTVTVSMILALCLGHLLRSASFATGLFSPIQPKSGPIDLRAHYSLFSWSLWLFDIPRVSRQRNT